MTIHPAPFASSPSTACQGRRSGRAAARDAAVEKPYSGTSLDFARDERKTNKGFTLLELLVVLAILGLLAAIVGPQVIRYLGSSKTQSAQVQAKNVVASLNLFRLDAGRFPTEEEGLAALVKAPPAVPNWNGPYLPDEAAITDPWGKPYRMKVPGDHGEVDVWSYGSDGVAGGTGEARDVGSW